MVAKPYPNNHLFPTNSYIPVDINAQIVPSDDHIPFKIPASKKTSEELFITVQSNLMRNFLVSCNLNEPGACPLASSLGES